jgi:hypothetical protein
MKISRSSFRPGVLALFESIGAAGALLKIAPAFPQLVLCVPAEPGKGSECQKQKSVVSVAA